MIHTLTLLEQECNKTFRKERNSTKNWKLTAQIPFQKIDKQLPERSLSATVLLFKKTNFLSILLTVTVIGISTAKECPERTLAIHGVCVHSASDHQQQPILHSSKISQTEAMCPIGFRQVTKVGEQLKCQKCSPGTYNAVPGSAICMDCPSGSESLAGAIKCTSRLSSPITCYPGQYYNEGECKRCPPGMCSIGSGATSCFRPPLGEGCPRGFLPP